VGRWLESRAAKALAAAERRNRAYAERQPFRWTAKDTLGVLVCGAFWTLLPLPLAIGVIVTAVALRLGRDWVSRRRQSSDAPTDDADLT
jgi:hypothetical protein